MRSDATDDGGDLADGVPEAALRDVQELLRSGDLFRYTRADASPVTQLETAFADYLGCRYALAVNSCSSAIFLALKALSISQNGKVLLPAFTFGAVPSAVVHASATPILINTGRDLRLDTKDFVQKLDQGAEAVLISHMRGHTSDMDTITSLCTDRGVPLIEDAAHSLGTKWDGRKIGTLGQIGCFSFQSYKLINAGEGGMIVSDDPDLMARAIIMSGAYERNWRKHQAVSDACERWQGRLPLYNMRMNNLSAVVAYHQIALIDQRVERGRANHDRVAALLQSSPYFDVPKGLPEERRAPDSIQFHLEGFANDADAAAFQRCAATQGVDVQIFGLSEGNARAYWNWAFIPTPRDLAPTRKILQRVCDVRLPPHFSDADCDRIAHTILRAAEQAAPSQASKTA